MLNTFISNVTNNEFDITRDRFVEDIPTIRAFECCSGMGVPSMAMKRIASVLGFNYEIVGIAEINKTALKGYHALHGKTKNYGDVTKINWSEIDCDFLSFTFPCTSLSKVNATSVTKGFEQDSNTASSVIWSLKNMFNQIKHKPKVLFMENVSDILYKKYIKTFLQLIQCIEDEGYSVQVKQMNSKDYGVPQNRERVFIICTLNEDIDFMFPQEMELKTKLSDILEKEVDDYYYIQSPGPKDTIINKSMSRGFSLRVHNPSHCQIAHSITTKNGSVPTDNFVFDVDLNGEEEVRVKASDLEMCGLNVDDIRNSRIRKLTPHENMRLMGFNEEEEEKLQNAKLSPSQIAFLCGNAIVVDVLEYLFTNYYSAALSNNKIEERIAC